MDPQSSAWRKKKVRLMNGWPKKDAKKTGSSQWMKVQGEYFGSIKGKLF